MAHFAKLDENNVVLEVLVVNNDVITVDGKESEQAGIDFLTELFGHSYWRQTSYNGNFRKNYAGKGYVYDLEFDAFRASQPYPSWKLNYETFRWEAPVAKPNEIEGYIYKWSEINQEWVQVAISLPTE
jgi:hypothetical protein